MPRIRITALIVSALVGIVDAPAAGSNLRADAMAVDALVEIWPGRSRLDELRRGIAGIDAAHDVSAIHFDVEELPVIAMKPRRAPVKRLTLIQRLAGLSRAEFRLHWTTVHGEMARELPFARGYAQNVVTGGDDRLDGFAIMHFDAVDRVLHQIFLRHDSALGVTAVVTIEPGSNLLRDGRIRQQVSGNLFHHEPVERLIAIECLNYPVAPAPHLPLGVRLIAIGIGIPRRVQPTDGHALSITRRCE